MTASVEPSDGARSSDLRLVLRVLRRRAWIIVLCGVLGAASALATSLAQRKEYTASASLLFRDPGLDQNLFGSQLLLPTSSSDPTREAATNLILVSLDTVAALTAKDLGTSQGAISSAVSVQADGNSDVVSINAKDRSPKHAALVANTYAREYVAFRREADQQKIRGAQQLVQHQLAVMTPQQQNTPDGRSLRDRAEQLKILASLQTGNAEIVAQARPPQSPSSPRPVRNGVLGGLLGLLVGIAVALVLDRLDRRIKDLDEAEEVFELPVLGEIPENRAYESPEPDGHDSEAFHLLRARLRYFNIDREIRSVLVTSAAPGEGKSTVAWHLARAAAMAGTAKVLLIEADLRRPTLRSQRGVDPVPGLSELLTHHVPLQDVVKQIPTSPERGDESPILYCIPAGLVPPDPAALMESHRMASLLELLIGEYDFVVIDTPPTSVVSDAMPLVPKVDGVVIVTRQGKSTRDAAKRLRQELDALHAPVLGFVFNGVKAIESDSYYGYRYSYTTAPREQDEELASLLAERSYAVATPATDAVAGPDASAKDPSGRPSTGNGNGHAPENGIADDNADERGGSGLLRRKR